MTRRKFIFNSLKAAGLIGFLYAWQIEPFWLEFVHKKMPLPHLPQHLVGKTLIHISDLHIGKHFNPQFVIDSFNEAQHFKPDFVVYTGDFVSYDDEAQLAQLENVLQYALHGSMGTLAVLGNHDYGENWSDKKVANKVISLLQKTDIPVLRNESAALNGLNFLGFDDLWGLNFHPKKTMKKYQKGQATIALCHNPDVCDLDIWQDFQGWILSGHTHGGQCKPPFLPPPLLPVKNRNYTAGEFDLSNGRTLYINRALGHLWQLRFNVRPEITVFELAEGG